MSYTYVDVKTLAEAIEGLYGPNKAKRLILEATEKTQTRIQLLPESRYPEFISMATDVLLNHFHDGDVLPSVRKVGRIILIRYSGQVLAIPSDKAHMLGNRINLQQYNQG